jgi:hypothetical protein
VRDRDSESERQSGDKENKKLPPVNPVHQSGRRRIAHGSPVPQRHRSGRQLAIGSRRRTSKEEQRRTRSRVRVRGL